MGVCGSQIMIRIPPVCYRRKVEKNRLISWLDFCCIQVEFLEGMEETTKKSNPREKNKLRRTRFCNLAKSVIKD